MGKPWLIMYWVTGAGKNEIERWLNKLTNEQLASVTKELVVLEKCGNELKLPHSRSLGKGLFELRERTFGYRVYYTFYQQQTIILLLAGDKSTQKNDILIARKRVEEIKNKGAL